MKNIISGIILFTSFSFAFAQDIITKTNGDEIQAIIKEITTNEIKYKRHDNPDGPLIHILKSDVFRVRYENGVVDIITTPTSTAPEKSLNEEHPAQPKAHGSVVEPVKLNGPRIGFSYISPGKTADQLRDNWNASPYLTLFGWQFETQFFSLPSGTTGVLEFVPLIAGLEQGLFLPSGSMLVGLRGPTGMEFGVGPNLSIAGAAFVFAAGLNFRTSEINFPVNLAVVASPHGMRYSIVMGFNLRSY
jgi:hypothetical protein